MEAVEYGFDIIIPHARSYRKNGPSPFLLFHKTRHSTSSGTLRFICESLLEYGSEVTPEDNLHNRIHSISLETFHSDLVLHFPFLSQFNFCMLQAGWSLVQLPMRSLDFSIHLILPEEPG
jgi:hypothetical protein